MNDITYICNNTSNDIDNVNKINIHQLNEILTGSLGDVYCDCLDTLDHDSKVLTLIQIMTKIGLNKSLKIRILDKTLLGKHMYFDTINTDDLNKILSYIRSISVVGDIIEIICRNTNFEIMSTDIEQNFYTITVKRIK